MRTLERLLHSLFGPSDDLLHCWVASFGYGRLDCPAVSPDGQPATAR